MKYRTSFLIGKYINIQVTNDMFALGIIISEKQVCIDLGHILITFDWWRAEE